MLLLLIHDSRIANQKGRFQDMKHSVEIHQILSKVWGQLLDKGWLLLVDIRCLQCLIVSWIVHTVWGHNITLFSLTFDTHPPPRNANDVEPYMFVKQIPGNLTPVTPTALHKT